MRMNKSAIITILFMFALMLYAPTLTLFAAPSQTNCGACFSVDNEASAVLNSVSAITDLSIQISNDLCCSTECDESNHHDSHCHDLHCHRGLCCDSYTANTRYINVHQSISIKNSYEVQIFIEDLVASIFKPPQM